MGHSHELSRGFSSQDKNEVVIEDQLHNQKGHKYESLSNLLAKNNQ